jgi:hypothetical protein
MPSCHGGLNSGPATIVLDSDFFFLRLFPGRSESAAPKPGFQDAKFAGFQSAH